MAPTDSGLLRSILLKPLKKVAALLFGGGDDSKPSAPTAAEPAPAPTPATEQPADNSWEMEPATVIADTSISEEPPTAVETETTEAAGPNLAAMKLTDLKKMAKERGLKGYSKLNKSDIVKLLS